MEVLNNHREKIYPTAGDAYGAAWNIMWKVFVGLFAIVLIHGIISGPTVSFKWDGNTVYNDIFRWWMVPLGIFAAFYGVFIAGPIGYGVSWVFLKAVRGENFEIKDMFSVFYRNYWNAVGANLVVGIIIFFGFVMLIVPGIIFACRLAFVPYLIVDRKMELTEALNKSWEMTKGYGGQIFLMGILAFLVGILGLIALFVGVFVSIVWIQTAFAAMYQAVLEHEGHFQEIIVEDKGADSDVTLE